MSTSTFTRPRHLERRVLSRRRPHLVTLAVGLCTAVVSAVWVTAVAAPALTPTQSALRSSLDPSMQGQAVTLVATVGAGGGAASGTVDFRDGATLLATRPVSGGRSSLTVSTLGAGDHPITADYSGDSTYAASTSPAVTQTVTTAGTHTLTAADGDDSTVAAPSSAAAGQTVGPPVTTATRTAVASSANPARSGVPVTFTATVSSASGTPTGSVTFEDGTTVLAVRPLAGGRSTLTLRTLAAGRHNVSAVYGGSSGFAASTSPPVSQSVTAGAAPAPSGSAHTAPMARGEAPIAGGTMTR